MRRFLAISVAMCLSACATRPAPQPQPPPPIPMSPQIHSNLLGLTAGELIQRLGAPALQIREGRGLKLQFRGRSCVLDAYLYPPLQGAGAERVTHVDARLPNGNDTDQLSC